MGTDDSEELFASMSMVLFSMKMGQEIPSKPWYFSTTQNCVTFQKSDLNIHRRDLGCHKGVLPEVRVSESYNVRLNSFLLIDNLRPCIVLRSFMVSSCDPFRSHEV